MFRRAATSGDPQARKEVGADGPRRTASSFFFWGNAEKKADSDSSKQEPIAKTGGGFGSRLFFRGHSTRSEAPVATKERPLSVPSASSKPSPPRGLVSSAVPASPSWWSSFQWKAKMFVRVIFCSVLLSYVIFCHMAWLGCYEYMETRPISFQKPSTTVKGASGDFLSWGLSSAATRFARFIQEVQHTAGEGGWKEAFAAKPGEAPTSCPTLPAMPISIFHFRWFYEVADIPQSGRLLYETIHRTGTLRAVILFSAAVACLAEWILLAYILIYVIWAQVIRPVIRLMIFCVVVALIIKLLYTVLLQLGPKALPGDLYHDTVAVLSTLDTLVDKAWAAASAVALYLYTWLRGIYTAQLADETTTSTASYFSPTDYVTELSTARIDL